MAKTNHAAAKTTLVIVESAAKAKTLGKFLGRSYKVKASVGHIKDLPKSKLGIDIENHFEPQYITIRGKGELLKELKSEAAKAKRVLLATDPDREGEAIAWHLKNAINIEDEGKYRVEFHEITKDAVLKAIKTARPLDMDLVNAQQARRVLDRLVGYKLSPLLWAKIHKGLSAGRVQTVALRIICEREREIEAFVPKEYWTIDAELMNVKKENFWARLTTYQKKKLEIGNAEQKDRILKELSEASYTVVKVDEKERMRKANPPFTTSTMQQEASRRLNFFARRTMKVAQELYEGLNVGKEGAVGLITYLRTDSQRVSPVAQEEALNYIRTAYGASFAPKTPNQYKIGKASQDAHEAIRPTSVERTPESLKPYLTRDQYRLYKLIWERFVASQMTPAVYHITTAEIAAGEYGLRASSSSVYFPGYQKVYADQEENIDKKPLPELKPGETVSLKKLEGEQHFTQPPARYTDASLVKALEEQSIGRPSTYAPIVETILKRGYVERQNRQFVPTDLGFTVVELLIKYFGNVFEVDFTAEMEENLDKIARGEREWKAVLEEFYTPFSKDLEQAETFIDKIEVKDEEAGRDCPECGKPLLIKNGRFGKFIACSGFPTCRYTESIDVEIGVACPLCGAPILEKKSQRGRKYYVCKNHQKEGCSFLTWNKPTGERCPICGDFMVEKASKDGTVTSVCQNRQCGKNPGDLPVRLVKETGSDSGVRKKTNRGRKKAVESNAVQ